MPHKTKWHVMALPNGVNLCQECMAAVLERTGGVVIAKVSK